MRNNPYLLLVGVSLMLWLGAQSWRRRKIKRAMRDLPTRMQRLLGPEPLYLPPDDGPDDLGAYSALHDHTRRVEWIVRGVAVLWLFYVLTLVLKGMPQ